MWGVPVLGADPRVVEACLRQTQDPVVLTAEQLAKPDED